MIGCLIWGDGPAFGPTHLIAEPSEVGHKADEMGESRSKLPLGSLLHLG